jgi:hypothetical protein
VFECKLKLVGLASTVKSNRIGGQGLQPLLQRFNTLFAGGKTFDCPLTFKLTVMLISLVVMHI